MEGTQLPASTSSNVSSVSTAEPISDGVQAVEGPVASSSGDTATGEVEDGEDMEIEADQQVGEVEGNMEVHLDGAGDIEQAEEMMMEAGPSNAGKRVKVCTRSSALPLQPRLSALS